MRTKIGQSRIAAFISSVEISIEKLEIFGFSILIDQRNNNQNKEVGIKCRRNDANVLGVRMEINGDATRCLSEASLTEARFSEASSGISCTWFRVLMRPKQAQDSLRHKRKSGQYNFIENYLIFGI